MRKFLVMMTIVSCLYGFACDAVFDVIKFSTEGEFDKMSLKVMEVQKKDVVVGYRVEFEDKLEIKRIFQQSICLLDKDGFLLHEVNIGRFENQSGETEYFEKKGSFLLPSHLFEKIKDFNLHTYSISK